MSSALLQRFAGATLGGFSDAFDSLMLADVLQIDADIYEQIDLDNLDQNGTERYFYYAQNLQVYRVASTNYIKENPNVTFYHLAYSGESTSFMKKLAYVRIDDMADAMEAVIDDMMFSEFVDVFTEDAVELSKHNVPVSADNPLSADKKYFVAFGEDGNEYVADDSTQYVYVYDSFGDYTKANFRSVAVTDNISESTVYFKYVNYSTLSDSDIDMAKAALLMKQGNMYYFDKKDGQYKQNYALCMYMLVKSEYRNQVYFREKVTADGDGVFSGQMKHYGGATLEYGLFVKIDSVGYVPYDENNPVLADRPLVTFEKSATNNFEDTFFIDKSEVPYLSAHLKDDGFETNGIYFARRKCIDVYVLTENTENTFVFIDGQYVPYDSSKHADMQRFECRQGYIGEINEVSYDDGTATELTLYDVNFIRERSTAVLRTLARGTIGEMTSIITNATVGDIIDAEPGTMFDKDIVKEAKITQLGTAFKDILTTMTISELMTWSNVSGVAQNVKNALEGVTIQTLFSSLVIDETTQEIKVDMLKVYGYEVV